MVNGGQCRVGSYQAGTRTGSSPPLLPPALKPGHSGMGPERRTAVPRRHWQRKEQEGEGHQVQRDGSPGQHLGH